MTTKTTTSPAAAGEQLLTAVRARLAGDEVDVDTALDDFAATLPDPADATNVRTTVQTVLDYAQSWAGRGDPGTGRLLALGRCYLVAAALDRTTAPFPKLAELRAAEQAVTDAERAADQALTDLEQAVADHDVERVMKLRGEVEVGHPGRIAEAKMAMLRLQIEQAHAHAEPGLARIEASIAALHAAQDRLAELVKQVKRAEIEVRARFADRDGAQAASRELVDAASALTSQLKELEANHASDSDARLRRIAGLPPKVAQVAAEESPQAKSLIGTSTQPYAPENRPDTFVSVGTARHIAAPVVDGGNF